MVLTVYDKQLIASMERMFPDENAGMMVKMLIEMGVVDPVRCKVLAVRVYVDDLMKKGNKKIESMYIAAERFCCSYEYIRKCMYYYKDVNLIVHAA